MVHSAILSSPVGKIRIEATARGIRRLSLAPADTAGPPSAEIPEALRACAEQLSAYFAGKLKTFDLRLDLEDAPRFNVEIWKMVMLIPYGRTRTYTDIAEITGHPQASRAVGHAIGQNPIPIIIPCHRVIGKDGSLTGYLYGLDMKRWLLAHESPGKYMRQVDLVDALPGAAIG
jgi:methylated-DNA-[protein]-cysteine S-methyltransferase